MQGANPIMLIQLATVVIQIATAAIQITIMADHLRVTALKVCRIYTLVVLMVEGSKDILDKCTVLKEDGQDPSARPQKYFSMVH